MLACVCVRACVCTCTCVAADSLNGCGFHQGLEELGLIGYIGDFMVDLIKMVPARHQMLVALILVVWVSALASSFIDNIPFTTATVSQLRTFYRDTISKDTQLEVES